VRSEGKSEAQAEDEPEGSAEGTDDAQFVGGWGLKAKLEGQPEAKAARI
jgi:hypothetical protein